MLLLARFALPLAAQFFGGEGGGLLGFLLPLVLIGAVFYFLIIRPQRQREQERQEMVNDVEEGDQIVTIGGMHGSITKVEDDSILADVGSETRIRFDKDAIASVNGVSPDDDE
jgi:preprotein translocase subunit YajC